MDNKIYTITAYKILLKKREKAPKGRSMEELEEKDEYLYDKKLFLNDFYSYIMQKNYEKEKYYFNVEKSMVADDFVEGELLHIKYGRSGREFITIDRNNYVTKFDEETKYVCNYLMYFFIFNNEILMVSFKYSNYGCKTALSNEIRKFLENTNVLLETKTTANEKYINEALEKSDFSTISFDKIININDGEKNKIKKEVISHTRLELKASSNRYLISRIIGFLKGEAREVLVTELSSNSGVDISYIDENSIKTTIDFLGIKRVVNLSDLENMMYDIDVTDKIEKDDNGFAIQESINEVVFDYVKGIKVDIDE